MENSIIIYKPSQGYNICKANIDNVIKEFIAMEVEIVNGVVTFKDVKIKHILHSTINKIVNIEYDLDHIVLEKCHNIELTRNIRKEINHIFTYACQKNYLTEESFTYIEEITIPLNQFYSAIKVDKAIVKQMYPWAFISNEEAIQKVNNRMDKWNYEIKENNNIIFKNCFDEVLKRKLYLINSQLNDDYNDKLRKYHKAKYNYNTYLFFIKWFKKCKLEKPIHKYVEKCDVTLSDSDKELINSEIEWAKNEYKLDIVEEKDCK